MASSDPNPVVNVSRSQPSRWSKNPQGKLPIHVRILKNKSKRIEFDVDSSFIFDVGFKVDIDDERSLHREGPLNLDVDDVSDSRSFYIDSLATANWRNGGGGSSRRFENARTLQDILDFSGKDWVGSATTTTVSSSTLKRIQPPKWIVSIALVFERVNNSVCQSSFDILLARPILGCPQ